MRKRLNIVASLVAVVGLFLCLPAELPAQSKRAGRPASSAAGEKEKPAKVLSNAEIIKMTKAELDDEIIVSAIHAADQVSFDTTPDGLIELQKADVSNKVIIAMQAKMRPAKDPSGAQSAVAAPTAARPRDPDNIREAGVYAAAEGRLEQLEPTVFSRGKMGSRALNFISAGVVKAKWKAVVRGSRANQRVASDVHFYFIFENSAGLSNGGLSPMQGATSPNEFVLAKLKPEENERSLIVGQAGGFGGPEAGVRPKDAIEFKAEKLAPGRYRVVPANPLPPGEYVFFYAAGSSTSGASNPGKMFDFGVDE